MDKSIDVNEILKKAAALYDEKKFSEAVELWKSIEDVGCAEALYRLGICYNYNRGVDVQDEEKRGVIASGYFMKAGEMGHADAQCFVGLCYRCGLGVDKDLKKSVEWFEKSAAQNCAQAMNNLGLMYEQQEVDLELNESDKEYEEYVGEYDDFEEDEEDGDDENGESGDVRRKKCAKSMRISFGTVKRRQSLLSRARSTL